MIFKARADSSPKNDTLNRYALNLRRIPNDKIKITNTIYVYLDILHF